MFAFASLDEDSITGTDIRESDVNIVQVPCLNSVTRRWREVQHSIHRGRDQRYAVFVPRFGYEALSLRSDR